MEIKCTCEKEGNVFVTFLDTMIIKKTEGTLHFSVNGNPASNDSYLDYKCQGEIL